MTASRGRDLQHEYSATDIAELAPQHIVDKGRRDAVQSTDMAELVP